MVHATSGPEIIVTGVRNSVSRETRRTLKRLAEECANDPQRIRTALAAANSDTAKRYPNLISHECRVESLDRSGQGRDETTGNVKKTLSSVIDGVDIGKLVKPFLEQIYGKGGYSFGNGTTYISKAGAKTTQSPPATICDLQVGDPAARATHLIVRLPSGQGQQAAPSAININGVVVGAGRPHVGEPMRPCVPILKSAIAPLRRSPNWATRGRCQPSKGPCRASRSPLFATPFATPSLSFDNSSRHPMAWR